MTLLSSKTFSPRQKRVKPSAVSDGVSLYWQERWRPDRWRKSWQAEFDDFIFFSFFFFLFELFFFFKLTHEEGVQVVNFSRPVTLATRLGAWWFRSSSPLLYLNLLSLLFFFSFLSPPFFFFSPMYGVIEIRAENRKSVLQLYANFSPLNLLLLAYSLFFTHSLTPSGILRSASACLSVCLSFCLSV